MRINEWLAGVAGVVLLVSLFLDWYSGASAWESFAVTDVLLAVAALFGIALVVTAATQRSPAVTQSTGALAIPIAFLGAVLVLVRLASPPGGGDGREIGAWLGTAATLGLLVAVWRSIGDQSFPRQATPQVEITPLPAPKPRSDPPGDE